MRFTYSVTIGSVMKRLLLSTSAAYDLPILISVSVEYQLPNPRPPISRFPTAPTSSMLPFLILAISLPGSMILSGTTPLLPAVSPPTGVVPGAGSFLSACLSLSLSLSFFSGCVACVSGGVAGVSPPTGVVPGAGCDTVVSEGGVLPGGVLDGED